jgi:hypothetical protein
MLVAQCPNPTIFPQFGGLRAKLASMEGLLFGDFNTLANSVIRIIDVDAQSAKLLFRLQDFKRASGFLLEFGDQWFQVPAQPPENVEPAVIVSEAPRHQGVANVTEFQASEFQTKDQMFQWIEAVLEERRCLQKACCKCQ